MRIIIFFKTLFLLVRVVFKFYLLKCNNSHGSFGLRIESPNKECSWIDISRKQFKFIEVVVGPETPWPEIQRIFRFINNYKYRVLLTIDTNIGSKACTEWWQILLNRLQIPRHVCLIRFSNSSITKKEIDTIKINNIININLNYVFKDIYGYKNGYFYLFSPIDSGNLFKFVKHLLYLKSEIGQGQHVIIGCNQLHKNVSCLEYIAKRIFHEAFVGIFQEKK